jgi:chromosome partitioning protein
MIDVGNALLQCSDKTGQFLQRVRDASVAPNSRKKLRVWGVSEASKLVGRSENTLRSMEVEFPELVPARTANGRRVYSLSLINAFRDRAGTRIHRGEGSRAIICAVTNFKGGAAKTTSAVHLAQRAALDGLRVLVVDLDPQATMTLLFGFIPDVDIGENDTISEALVANPASIMSVIRETYFTGIDLIPANLQLQDCELQLANPNSNRQSSLGLNAVERLEVALEQVSSDYDLIVVDCGPNLGLLSLNAVYAATGLLITIPPSVADFGSADLFTQSIGTLLSSPPFNRPRDFLRVMVTKHSGTSEAQNVEAMIRLAFSPFVLSGAMVQTVEMERAVNDFGTIYEIETPRGSMDAYRRALGALNEINGQMISLFVETWEKQVVASKQ